MTEFNYNDRYFRSLENSESGEVGDGTIFHYRQDGDLVWASYSGGEVRFGTLVALATQTGELEMRYHHLNTKGELKTGECRTRPEYLDDGRFRLHEEWRWTSGDGSKGTSVLEEIPREEPRPKTSGPKTPGPKTISAAPTEPERILHLLRSTFDGKAWHGPSLWPLLVDLTAQQAAAPPAAGAHSIWGLVAHATGWMEVVRKRLTGEGVAEPEENFPVPKTIDAGSWNASLAALRHAHESLCSAVHDLSQSCLLQDRLLEDRLSAVDPFSDFTIYEVLHGVVHHNLYHAGQIALLRRALGIPTTLAVG